MISDPGNGFGREARRYALTQHFQPAQDHDGNPIAGTHQDEGSLLAMSGVSARSP